MNGIDFDFKQVYGKEFDDMSPDERQVAVMSQLYYLRSEFVTFKKGVNECLDCIPRHQTYFKIIGILSGTVAAGLIGYLIKMAFGV
jgi:hypothetical protein